ncbi:type II secretion system protein GspL [Sphingosinicella soli]|uniref:General secretion pathway protein L n=1 Tax=Sphingosinicella soli TaxID=333708 RepID=A0A7W7B2M2_9SPHN|nr:type II secretion system protein GspL [Sphingosinicella soli]MBB4631920.1 general secretion pathway protein L [Sphingosinicella soli]
MSRRLFVLIPASGTALRWRTQGEDGRTLASGLLVDDDEAQIDEDTRVTAVVPGTAVSLHWVELPAASPAQAAAVARHLAADFVAAPIADQHVAAAAAAEADGRRLIGIVDRDVMAGWLAALAHHGLDPDEVVPAPLLLPVADDAVSTLRSGDMLIVRAPDLATETEAGLAEMLIGGRALRPILRDILDLPSYPDTPLNLRQGAFRKASQRAVGRVDIRRMALLAAGVVAAWLGADLALALRHHFAANAMEAEMQVLAAKALPGTAITDPALQIQQRYAASASSGGFTGMAASLFGALQASGTTRLESLRYEPGGAMRATLIAPMGATIDTMKQQMATDGLNLIEGASRSGDNGQRIDIEVTRL